MSKSATWSTEQGCVCDHVLYRQVLDDGLQQGGVGGYVIAELCVLQEQREDLSQQGKLFLAQVTHM